jgi:tetratricopeptide (TPR) repeat protein
MTAVIFLLSCWSFASAPPAVADDNFANGCRYYNVKKYAQAETFLNDTVRRFPAYWPGHYYLANTYLALGRREEARKEYDACITSQPSPSQEVVDVCKKTIVTLGGIPSEPVGAATPLGEAKPLDGKVPELKLGELPSGEKTDAPEAYRDKERRWHIERLRKQCSEKIAALREEMKQAMDIGQATTNHWWKSPDNPGPYTQMSDEQKAAIEKDYQERINKVEQDTEQAIAGIH